MVALVLLHGQMCVLCTWNVLAGHRIVVTSNLVISFFVEIESLRIKEVSSRQNVEAVLVVFTRSVLNFLSCVLLDSRSLFQLLIDGMRILRKCLDLWLTRPILSTVIELLSLHRRWRLSLVLEITI